MSSKNTDIYIRWAEPIIIICVWLLVLVSPILFLRESDYIQWQKVIEAWFMLLPFLVLFLINHFLLVPLFLFRNKKSIYFISAIAIIGLLLLNSLLMDRKGPPRENLPPHLHDQPFPPRPREDANNLQDNNRPPLPKPDRFPPFMNIMLISILMIGFDTGLRVSVKWYQLGKEKADLEKENVKNELAFLRNQISPHFFMNTLNNIHALVDVDTEQAKDAIIRLSKLMRQLLYESETDRVALKKELDFLQSYVNLMSLRFTDKVKVTMNIPKEVPDTTIPPSLYISLIENAFKHGVSYSAVSFIDIDFLMNNKILEFTVKNSKHKQVQLEEYSGIGIENTRKRLDLLYDKTYDLSVVDNDEMFQVKLNIPI